MHLREIGKMSVRRVYARVRGMRARSPPQRTSHGTAGAASASDAPSHSADAAENTSKTSADCRGVNTCAPNESSAEEKVKKASTAIATTPTARTPRGPARDHAAVLAAGHVCGLKQLLALTQ